MEKEGAGKKFEVPDWIIDDWTGTKFTKNILCYNKDVCPPAPIEYPKIKKGEASFIQIQHSLNTPGSDPMDPNLEDT